MKDVLMSHSGRQHSYRVALSMQKLGRLKRFITSMYYMPDRFPDMLITKFSRADRFMRKRHQEGLFLSKVRRFPFFELPELALRALTGNSGLTASAICARDAFFDRFVACRCIREGNIYWGFQGSCLESLRAAGRRGMVAIAEFATGHVPAAVRILNKERRKNPDWADSINNFDFPEWYINRLKSEPFAADRCVVASDFTADTLKEEGVPASKILRLPLGVDLDIFPPVKRKLEGPFQVLFVGSVGQRKGIKYLLDAVKKLRTANIVLKVIGPLIGSGRAFREYSRHYEYLGTLSQRDMAAHCARSHCLVLPSLFEGFGLVVPEAMATGMPVIATTHTAAPEIVREGVDGFVVEPSNADALAEKLEWMASNRAAADAMGRNASARAREYSWDMHARRLEGVLSGIQPG